MNYKKRIWALVLSAALIITCLPVMAFAEETPQNEDSAAAVMDEDLDAAPETAEEAEEVLPESSAAKAAVTGTAAVPKAVEFSGAGLFSTPGFDYIENLYTWPQCFTVTFSDGTTKDYVYGEYSYKDNKGKTVKREGFLAEGEDPAEESSYLEVFMYEDESGKTTVFKEGNNKTRLQINAPYIVTDSSGRADLNWKILYTDVYVWCTVDVPTSIRFVPAKGTTLQGNVGYNYIDESFFYGKGNSFEVTMTSKYGDADGIHEIGYTAQYKYTKVKHGDGYIEGFFDNGNIDYEQLDLLEEPVEVYLKKGNNKVSLPYYTYIPGRKDPVRLTLTVNIKATKLGAYANTPVFDYTGKPLSKKAFAKKLVVRDSDDNVIPASAYTYTWKPQKNVGWYTVIIKFKNKTKYTDTLTVNYGIGPKAPKITKLRGKKKRLTVIWKKFSKAQLKQIDGMYIEVAQDKNFTKGYRKIKISKKWLQKTRGWNIRKLSRKKRYYVRMYTYKTVKQNGETFVMKSVESNVRTAVTK